MSLEPAGGPVAAPNDKKIKHCRYRCGAIAMWSVRYKRHLKAVIDVTGKPLNILDHVCDDHLVVACSRATGERPRVSPRFQIGPGGLRLMSDGRLVGLPTPSQARENERERWLWSLDFEIRNHKKRGTPEGDHDRKVIQDLLDRIKLEWDMA